MSKEENTKQNQGVKNEEGVGNRSQKALETLGQMGLVEEQLEGEKEPPKEEPKPSLMFKGADKDSPDVNQVSALRKKIQPVPENNDLRVNKGTDVIVKSAAPSNRINQSPQRSPNRSVQGPPNTRPTDVEEANPRGQTNVSSNLRTPNQARANNPRSGRDAEEGHSSPIRLEESSPRPSSCC